MAPNQYNASYDGVSADSYGVSSVVTYSDQTVGTRYTYGTNGKLTQTRVSSYTAGYDANGNITTVSANENNPASLLAQYIYTDDKQQSNVSYANGGNVSYTFNDDGTVATMSIDGTTAYVYAYTEGKLISKTNITTGHIKSYAETADKTYSVVTLKDSGGNMLDTYAVASDGSSFEQTISGIKYGLAHSAASDGVHTTDLFTTNAATVYSKEDTLDEQTKNPTQSLIKNRNNVTLLGVGSVYNARHQLTQQQYSYVADDPDTLSYTYDALGNIETISKNGTQQVKYYYDNVNQQLRATADESYFPIKKYDSD